MVEERRTDLRGPTSTLEVENMISLYFQLCYEDIICLLGNNAGRERNLHATFHDETKQTGNKGTRKIPKNRPEERKMTKTQQQVRRPPRDLGGETRSACPDRILQRNPQERIPRDFPDRIRMRS